MGTNQRNPTFAEKLGRSIDTVIGIFDPDKATKRSMARMQLRSAGAYEDVPAWRNNADWVPMHGTGESLNAPSRDKARAKARHLERNSELVNSILNAFTRNVVGKGFNLQVRTENQDWNNTVEQYWAEWSRPGNCDVTGRLSLNEILRMIIKRKIVDGGILLLKTYEEDKSGIYYRLQLVEVDSLKSPGTIESATGNPIVNGIEVNSYGRPLKYYIEKQSADLRFSSEIECVDADRVIYLAELNRPTEIREMTPLARVLNDVKDVEDFFEAVGFKQKINAALAVFITSDKDVTPTVGRSIVRQNNDGQQKIGKRIDSGSITELPPGKDVKTLVPSGQSSELADFNLAVNRRIGAGHGLSYEMMSRDVSQVNYSSARQNMLEDWKTFEMEQNYLIEHFLDFVFEDVIVAAYLAGRLPGAPKDFMQNRPKYLKHEFLGQGLPWIDPLKEAQANQVMLATGQTTLKDIYAKKGKDWEAEYAQIAIEAEMAKELGLVRESVPIIEEKTKKGEEKDE